MTVRARSLLGAADSRRHKSQPEDRLTEILREVLMTSPLLAARIVSRAFDLSDDEGERFCRYGDYEVDTQVGVRGGGCLDMRFRFTGEHQPPGRLYCENKINAGFTDFQRRGFPSVPEGSRVVVFSPGGDRRPDESAKFVSLSWTDLARMADDIGRSWKGPEWRAESVGPKAPGQYRMVAELLWYLEREEHVRVTVTGPITDGDLELLPGAEEVAVRWQEFRRLVRAELHQRLESKPKIKIRPGGWDPELNRKDAFGFHAILREEESGSKGAGWPALERLAIPAPPRKSWRELVAAPKAPWMEQDAPFVAVGVGLEMLPEWSDAQDGIDEWRRLREAVRAKGGWLGFTEREKVYRILMPRSLAEILGPEPGSLEEQAEHTVEWALRTLDELVAIEAGSSVK